MKNFLLNIRQFRLLALVLSIICGFAGSAFAQAITDFNPKTGPVGTAVTITGSNLSSIKTVKFNGNPGTITSSSNTQIVATVPGGTTIGKVSLSTQNGTTVSSTTDFTPYMAWTGAINSAWDNDDNWADGIAPNNTTNVVINAGTPFSPQINSAAVCNNLTLSTGASLSLIAGSDLSVRGVFSALGSYTHSGGKITFAADGGIQHIPALTYYDLATNGTGVKQIQGNITVNGDLTLAGVNNNLTTAQPTNTITLNGSISGEIPGRSYIGRLEKTRTVSGVVSDNFGNIGIGFVNTGGGNWGDVTATRITGQAIVNPIYATRKSISRYWIITPTIETANSNVQLTLTWFDTENNGLTFPNNMAQAWRKATGSTEWLPVDDQKTIISSGNLRSITVSTTSFSSWAIADQNNPLPVSMTYFKGKATAAGSLLEWATASEKNSAAFEVERSINGKDFEKVGMVNAAGNSNSKIEYTFTDRNAQRNLTNYYRLRQVDLDGSFEYSAIVTINSAKTAELNAVAYPNPFNGTLNLKLNNAVSNAEVIVMTIDGKQVHRQVIKEASSNLALSLPNLKPGFYLLNLVVDNKVTVLKVAQQ